MKQVEFKKTAPAGPAEADFYALLGLEERFAIDIGELEQRYLERSKQVHPDRFVTAAAHERVNALQQAMQLNQAYKTLKKPIARAEYLLRRHGVVIHDNEQLDPGFLMEVLEMREEQQEARLAGDTGKLRALESEMVARRQAALERVAGHFAAIDVAAIDRGGPGQHGQDSERAGLADIKRELILLRYIQRYLEAFADDFEDDFEDEEREA